MFPEIGPQATPAISGGVLEEASGPRFQALFGDSELRDSRTDLGDRIFYTPLALKTAKGQHLPTLEVYSNQSPMIFTGLCVNFRRNG